MHHHYDNKKFDTTDLTHELDVVTTCGTAFRAGPATAIVGDEEHKVRIDPFLGSLTQVRRLLT